MAKTQRFSFLCNDEERRILTALAQRLQRSQSDSVRWLIREAAHELKVKPQREQTQPQPAEVSNEAQAA